MIDTKSELVSQSTEAQEGPYNLSLSLFGIQNYYCF